jgi:hypothetical protein
MPASLEESCFTDSAVVLVGVFLATLSSPRKDPKSDQGEVHEEPY